MGSQQNLAEAIGTTQAHVSMMVTRDKKASPKYVENMVEAVDGKVSRQELRPDIFKPETKAA